MDSRALAVVEPVRAVGPLTVKDAIELGPILAQAGYFADTREAAQAVVKVLKGQALGLDPVTAVQEIQFIQGRLSLSAGCVAALIQRSGRFNFRVRRLDETGCELEFSERGKSLGVSTFTLEDAKRAGLSGNNWQKYPRNMLFARALTNGARWYASSIFLGAVYTPDELGGSEGQDDSALELPQASAAVDFAQAERLRVEPAAAIAANDAPEFVVRTIPDPLDLYACRHWLGDHFCPNTLTESIGKDGKVWTPADKHQLQVEKTDVPNYPVCESCFKEWWANRNRRSWTILDEPVQDGEIKGELPF